jgi:hypothetical protein
VPRRPVRGFSNGSFVCGTYQKSTDRPGPVARFRRSVRFRFDHQDAQLRPWPLARPRARSPGHGAAAPRSRRRGPRRCARRRAQLEDLQPLFRPAAMDEVNPVRFRPGRANDSTRPILDGVVPAAEYRPGSSRSPSARRARC